MRRRPRRGEPMPDHTSQDRWLLSYGDFITVLFALFVVLFATAYRDNQSIRKVSQAIHVGFQQMAPASIEPMDHFTGSASPTPVTITPIAASADTRETAPAGTAIDFTQLQQRLQAAVGDEIRNHEVVMHATPEGFVISLRDLGFFNSGQAVLMPGASGKIRRIATVLAEQGLSLRVEGHSDDQPIHTPQYRSNWELSTGRAMAVLMLLVDDSGIDPARVSVAGYGQYKPVADNSTAEGRQMNRRVDLVVVGLPAVTAPAPAPPAGVSSPSIPDQPEPSSAKPSASRPSE